MKILKSIFQYFCSHKFDIRKIEWKDIQKTEVSCPCRKCLKICVAPYGLALPGQLDQGIDI